jgi:glycosyltransferase involved in cell wall biosynthesis
MLAQNVKYSLILHMSTYPPRKCGIATFTQDLLNAVNKGFNPSITSKILVINNDDSRNLEYPEEVIFKINDKKIQEYIDVARKINEMDEIKVVNVQHEFGIFGGKYGEFIIPFLTALKKPVVTTLHTVRPSPRRKMKEIVQQIAKKSSCITVMNKIAVEILRNDYELKNANIEIIPHGIHDVSFEPSIVSKKRLGYENHVLLSSFGLLRGYKYRTSFGKGYEYVLEALSEVIKKFPNVL